MSTRVLLVDDEALVRRGISALLRLEPEFAVTEAGDGAVALRLIDDQTPDVTLLDVRMPVMGGLAVLERLRERDPVPRCILLTTFDDREVLLESIRLGARGYLRKDVTLAVLVQAIRIVIAGKTYFHPSLTASLLAGLRKLSEDAAVPPFAGDGVETLTQRETEVLRLLAGGYSNREVAYSLQMTEGTVKIHVSNILGKLHVRDRLQAVLKALQNQLV